MKNMKIMTMLLGGLMVLGCLTACSSDDDPMPQPEPAKELTSLKVNYTATVSQQLLDVATVTVRYVGENGQVASEQMSSTTWTKSVTLVLPARAGMNIQSTPKGSIADGEYTLSAQGQMAYSWLDQDGQQLRAGSTEQVPSMEAVFYADGLGQYLGAITANCQLGRSFAKDYSVTDVAITWGGNAGDDSTQSIDISDEGATGDNR